MTDTAYEAQHLDWPGLLNVRDVGGLPTGDGGRIRSGALIRADSLHKLTEAGVQAVLQSGVSRIVDLRRESETSLARHPFVDDERYLNIPVQDPADPDHEWMSLAEIYQAMLDLRQALFATAVAAVADAPDGAVVVHCAGGKDRTGLVVAMSLVVAGVESAVIAADYALTEARLQEESDHRLAEITDERLRQRVSGLIRTPPENMLSTLSHLDERYGGAVEYLRGGGMSDEHLTALRARLRET